MVDSIKDKVLYAKYLAEADEDKRLYTFSSIVEDFLVGLANQIQDVVDTTEMYEYEGYPGEVIRKLREIAETVWASKN